MTWNSQSINIFSNTTIGNGMFDCTHLINRNNDHHQHKAINFKILSSLLFFCIWKCKWMAFNGPCKPLSLSFSISSIFYSLYLEARNWITGDGKIFAPSSLPDILQQGKKRTPAKQRRRERKENYTRIEVHLCLSFDMNLLFLFAIIKRRNLRMMKREKNGDGLKLWTTISVLRIFLPLVSLFSNKRKKHIHADISTMNDRQRNDKCKCVLLGWQEKAYQTA